MLTHHELRKWLTYSPETGEFWWNCAKGGRTAGSPAGCVGLKGYRSIGICGRSYLAHRLAWLYMTGAWPDAEIDHANLDGGDNRWVNLRAATRAENCRNRRPHRTNTSGYKGVIWDKRAGRWSAQIHYGRQTKRLGLYGSAEEAAAAYAVVARQSHGEFARTS